MDTQVTEKERTGRTKEQRERDYQALMERLRNTPEDKLTPLAKYWLEMDGKESEWRTEDIDLVFG